MDGKTGEIVVYFTNGRMILLPEDQLRFIRSPQAGEVKPDFSGDAATVNWDNVTYTRRWQEPQPIDP